MLAEMIRLDKDALAVVRWALVQVQLQHAPAEALVPALWCACHPDRRRHVNTVIQTENESTDQVTQIAG
jgi:hypothetical protein